MGYGNNLDAGSRLAKDNEVGESVEEIAPSAAQVLRPLLRCLVDVLDCLVKFRHEGLGGLGVSRQVPFARGSGLLDGFGMEPRRLDRHYRSRIWRRASGHGIGVTAPESSSWMRLAIS